MDPRLKSAEEKYRSDIISLSRKPTGGCEFPSCPDAAFARSLRGAEGYVESCYRHAALLVSECVADGSIRVKSS